MRSHRKYSNNAELPLEIVNAILKDRYTKDEEEDFDYSATTLIAPIQQTILKQRYPDKLVEQDVMDLFWMFLGSVAHLCLEEAWHESMGSVIEERMYATIEGVTVSGKVDCYDNSELRDYKFTKVYKIMKGNFTEWELQLNIYRWLCHKNNIPVDKLTIFAFLLDWNKHNLHQKNYPEHKITRLNIAMCSLESIEGYIITRIKALQECKELPDNQLIPCTAQEMWQDVKDYALIKKGGKRAYRVFDTEQEAKDHAVEKGLKLDDEYTLEKRLTERTRCLYHCPAASVCKQHERLLQEEKPCVENTEPPLF